VLAFINLALALGRRGQPFTGFGTITARAMVRAAASRDRRPTSCRAIAASTTRPRARTSLRCGGSRRTTSPGGLSAYELLDDMAATADVRDALPHGLQPGRLGPDARFI
jgi:hypothetical protein